MQKSAFYILTFVYHWNKRDIWYVKLMTKIQRKKYSGILENVFTKSRKKERKTYFSLFVAGWIQFQIFIKILSDAFFNLYSNTFQRFRVTFRGYFAYGHTLSQTCSVFLLSFFFSFFSSLYAFPEKIYNQGKKNAHKKFILNGNFLFYYKIVKSFSVANT